MSLTGPDPSGLWIVAWIVDFFNQIGFLIIIGPVFLLLCATVLVILCKLFVRCFEIAMLECVAPVFFACMCGKTTKEYFKRFIIAFLSTVLDVVFTGIIFYIYAKYLDGAFNNVDITDLGDIMKMQNGFLSFLLVSIGAFILMIKTPRVLKNLVA